MIAFFQLTFTARLEEEEDSATEPVGERAGRVFFFSPVMRCAPRRLAGRVHGALVYTRWPSVHSHHKEPCGVGLKA